MCHLQHLILTQTWASVHFKQPFPSDINLLLPSRPTGRSGISPTQLHLQGRPSYHKVQGFWEPTSKKKNKQT